MSALIILPIVSILGFAWALTRRTKISPFVSPIVVLSGVVLLLFCVDFLRLMRPVSLALICAGWLCALVEARNWLKRLAPPVPRDTLFWLGGLAFIVLMLFDYNSRAIFVEWDEFSHWGAVIKLTLHANTAVHLVRQGFPLYFQDYPPGAAYAAYYFLRATGYQESVAIFSHAFVLLAASLPLIGAARKPLLGALVAAVVWVFVLCFGTGWSSVLIDQLVGVLFGASLVILWLERDRPSAWVALAPILGFLTLAKGSGFFFALLIIGFAILLYALRGLLACEFGESLAGRRRTAFLVISLCAGVTFCTSSLWTIHVRIDHIPPSLAGISLRGLFSQATKCCSTEREKITTSRFKNRMFGLEDHLGNATAATDAAGKTSTGKLVAKVLRKNWNAPGKLILAALLGGAILATLYRTRADKISYGVMIGACCAGGAGYCLMLLLYYLYAFSAYEGTALASFERFFLSYTYGLAYLLLAGLVGALGESGKRARLAQIALVLALLVILVSRPGKVLDYLQQGGSSYHQQRTEVSKVVHPFVDVTNPRSRVLLVWQIEDPLQNGLEYWMMRYEISPRNVNVLCFSFGPPLYPGDIWSCGWDEEKFRKALNVNDYVLVGNGLQSIKKVYPNVFSLADSGKNNQAFQVIRQAKDEPGLAPL